MSNKKSSKGSLLIILGIVCLASCAALIIYNALQDVKAEKFSAEKLSDVKSVIEQREGGSLSDDESSLSDDPSSQDDEGAYKMEAVYIDGYTYIGYLSMPSVELEMPVMDRWDDTLMKLSPCRYYGAIGTHDLVIAGHNYRQGFGKLKNLHSGDAVYFMDMNGIQHTYTVEEIEVLEADDVQPMISAGWDMSLYTCTYNGRQRLTVRCKEKY